MQSPTTENVQIKTPLEAASQEALRVLKAQTEDIDALYVDMAKCLKTVPDELAQQTQQEIDSLNRASVNFKQVQREVSDMSKELRARLGDARKSTRYKRLRILNTPSNGSIDLQEKQLSHFATGMNVYKLMLLTMSGAFLGVVIESLFFLLYVGHYIRRSGLIYGPFNFVYGFGAAAMSAVLYKFRNKGRFSSFIWGMIIGSAVEYVCSWVIEVATGARSWDYTGQPFNLNGRVSLLSALCWGALGVFWIKDVYPYIARFILKIPNSIGKALVIVLAVCFLADGLLTCATLMRWSQRRTGVVPVNQVERVLDEYYPDSYMEQRFPSMVFK